jgi:hypothetical protein
MYRRTVVLVAVTIGLYVLPMGAQAATLSIVPPVSNVQAGDIVRVSVVVNSEGLAVNNAESVLHFAPEFLQVMSLSSLGSVFSLWVEQPSFSNAAGEVRFNGGVPNPGFTGSSGTILTVVFTAKRAGVASLSLTDAAVRANDGLGTDVLTSSNGATVRISGPQPAPAEAPSAGRDVALHSSTHPDEKAWYAQKELQVFWTLPGGVTAVQTGVGASESTAPTVIYTPPISEKTTDPLEDGVWYFKMRYRTAGGWSPVSTFRANIDTVAPEITSNDFLYDPDKRLLAVRVTARDDRSGIARYELEIDGKQHLVDSTNLTRPFVLPFDEPGVHSVHLTVFDRAGNSAVAEGSFLVSASLESLPFIRIGGILVTLMQAFLIMFAIAMLSLAVAIASWYRLWRIRHLEHVPLQRVRHEAQEAEAVSEHAFRVLREGVARHVALLKKTKRKLTTEEEEFLEEFEDKLGEAEGLIQKEIRDISNLS